GGTRRVSREARQPLPPPLGPGQRGDDVIGPPCPSPPPPPRLSSPAPCLFPGGRRCRAWRMMNFRQRMGWIGVGLYLIASAAAFYYVFEINETYNRLALEHIQQPPEKLREETTWMHSLKTRLLSVPFWLWTLVFLIPYLQMFLFLYSCTRADPKTVGYCIIPICLAVVCNRHQTFVKASNQISRLQLIDT
ncbi:hypothetical protein JRQ81_015804, partial [Phrynocephalus forsythii]